MSTSTSIVPLGGPPSSTLLKLEAHIKHEKQHAWMPIFRSYLKTGRCLNGLVQAHIKASKQIQRDDYMSEQRAHEDGHLKAMMGAIWIVLKGIRYLQYLAAETRVRDVRLHTMMGLKEGKWSELPPELRGIIYGKLVECAMEEREEHVICVRTQTDIDAISHSLLSLPIPAPTMFKEIEVALKSKLLERAPFDFRLDLSVPNPGSPTKAVTLHPTMLKPAAHMRHLDIDLHVVLEAYSRHGHLCDIIKTGMPLLQVFNLSIYDSFLDSYDLTNRAGTGPLQPLQYTGELVTLIQGISALNLERKWYRFMKTLAGEGADEPAGYIWWRRAVVCEADDTWVEASEDHLSNAELWRRVLKVNEELKRISAEADGEAEDAEDFESQQEETEAEETEDGSGDESPSDDDEVDDGIETDLEDDEDDEWVPKVAE
ncbi:hypothetical protein LTR85_009045 [Meristemomyces frigidus]|nr:hypothetical protein LTR85_009045 [Meristemomyces frigidus]